MRGGISLELEEVIDTEVSVSIMVSMYILLYWILEKMKINL